MMFVFVVAFNPLLISVMLYVRPRLIFDLKVAFANTSKPNNS